MNKQKQYGGMLWFFLIILALAAVVQAAQDIAVKWSGPVGQGDMIFWSPETGKTNLVLTSNGVSQIMLAGGMVTGLVTSSSGEIHTNPPTVAVTRQTMLVYTSPPAISVTVLWPTNADGYVTNVFVSATAAHTGNTGTMVTQVTAVATHAAGTMVVITNIPSIVLTNLP